MEKINKPIILTTALLIIFAVFSGLDLNVAIVSLLFILVNGAFVWMIIKILKDGKPSTKSFDEYFYEDREDLKRNS